MSNTALYSRIARRETHSPRSLLAIVLAVVLIAVFAWIGTEIVLALLGLPALLVAPVDMFTSAIGVTELALWIVVGSGVVVAVLGLVLIVAALAPGRRARHVLDTQRAVTVVDNEVIASALARHASAVGNVDPDNASVAVSHRSAVIHLAPTSGTPVNHDVVIETVTEQLDSYGLRPALRPRVHIAEKGMVGA